MFLQTIRLEVSEPKSAAGGYRSVGYLDTPADGGPPPRHPDCEAWQRDGGAAGTRCETQANDDSIAGHSPIDEMSS